MWNTCGECSAHSEWLQYVAQKEYKRTHDKVCLSIIGPYARSME